MALIRTFVAIHLTPELGAVLQRAQEALRASPGGAAGRYVQPGNMHLTIKFLGDLEEARLPGICQAVAAVAAHHRPLALTLGALGCFPNARRPRVVWAGVEDAAGRLARLASELDQTLHPLGFARETRPFAAHLTLARLNERADPAQAAALAQAALALAPLAGAMTANIVAVVQSELRQGPRYTDLCQAPLGAPTAR